MNPTTLEDEHWQIKSKTPKKLVVVVVVVVVVDFADNITEWCVGNGSIQISSPFFNYCQTKRNILDVSFAHFHFFSFFQFRYLRVTRVSLVLDAPLLNVEDFLSTFNRSNHVTSL